MQEGRKKVSGIRKAGRKEKGTTSVLPSCIPAFLIKNSNSQRWKAG
jgi:hypothetical protein